MNTYEQKYKQALVKLKEHFTPTSDGTIAGISRELIENIFPELKESKDDRIRKTLIRYHQSTLNIDGVKGEEILAWLEKQTIPDNLVGTDMDGGVVGEKGEQGETLFKEHMENLKKRIEDNQLGCIVQRLDKIIELLQSAILIFPKEPYVPPITYTTANTFGSDYDIDTDKIKQDETNKPKS